MATSKSKKAKNVVVTLTPDQIMYTSIRKSSDGYNSAGVSAKFADNQYMNVSYEWKGEVIPDFVFDLMTFMQANAQEIEETSSKLSKENAAFNDRLSKLKQTKDK